MTSPRKRGRGARARGDEAPLPPIPTLAAKDPRFLLVALVAALCVAAAVTYRASTTDQWQHLLVGRVIWETGSIPHRHLWSWPTYGQPEPLPSWGFRALLWPFWRLGGVAGGQAWRWLTALGAFAAAAWTARRLGARGLTPLFVVALSALSYRARGGLRPESLVAVLLALELLVLEGRRARGHGGGLALLAIAWAWANVHLSYPLGLLLLAAHALAEWLHRRAGGRAESGERAAGSAWAAPGGRLARAPLALVLAGAVVVSFANPFGWRALWQPFEYFLTWRHEPIFANIPELAPLTRTWREYLRSGLPALVVAWPLLVVLRPRGRRFDLAEALTCALFTGVTLLNQRFLGLLMVAEAPYLARGLSAWAGFVRWPAWSVRPTARAALVAAACVLVSVPAWLDPRYPWGIAPRETFLPVRACDFLQRHALRGRLFNPHYFGGYVLWRFWPERALLPFMDVHQSGTPRDRRLAAYCFANREAWAELEEERGFDLALLDGHQEWTAGDRLPDFLDADPDWALVFRDDAAAVYLRRSGRLGGAADSLAYRVLPGGSETAAALFARAGADSALRARLRAELERAASASPWNARAHSYLATLAYYDGDLAEARRHLEAARRVEPELPTVHRRLGYLLMQEGRWREAIREFARELALGGAPLDEHLRMGQCRERLGERAGAIREYRRQLAVAPQDAAARRALERLGGPQ